MCTLLFCGTKKSLRPKEFSLRRKHYFRGTTQIAPSSRPDAPFGVQQPLCTDAAYAGGPYRHRPRIPRLGSHRTWNASLPARTCRRLSDRAALRPSPSLPLLSIHYRVSLPDCQQKTGRFRRFSRKFTYLLPDFPCSPAPAVIESEYGKRWSE